MTEEELDRMNACLGSLFNFDLPLEKLAKGLANLTQFHNRFLNISNYAFCIQNSIFDLVYGNELYHQIWNIKPSRLPAPEHQIYSPLFLDLLMSIRPALMNLGNTAPVTVRLPAADGKKFYTIRQNTLRKPHGGLYAIITTFHDVTSDQIAQAKTDENLQRYLRLFHTITSGVAIYKPTADGSNFIIQDINPAGLNITNTSRQNVIGRMVTEVFPSVIEMGLLDVFKRVNNTGTNESLPFRIYRDNRISVWVENQVYKLNTGEIVAIYDDLTLQKQQEEEINYNQYFKRVLLESLPGAVFIQEKDGRISACNRKLCSLLNLHPEDLDHFNIQSLLPAEDQEINKNQTAEVLQGERQQIFMETKLKTGPGKFIYCILEKKLFLDKDGKPGGIIGSITDITGIRTMEIYLKESEEKYRSITENLPDIIIEFNRRWEICYINEIGRRSMPENRWEMGSLTIHNIMPEEDTAAAIHYLKSSGSDTNLLTHSRLISSDGQFRSCMIRWIPLTQSGRENGYAAVILNISAFLEDIIKPDDQFYTDYKLTRQEINVARKLLGGLSYQQIADELYLSLATIRTHLQNIYNKAGVSNKQQLYGLLQNYQVTKSDDQSYLSYVVNQLVRKTTVCL